MGKKEEFTAHARESFDGEARKLMLAQIERFYSCNVKASHSYSVGDTVKLSRGTFLHGIPGMHGDLSAFDWVVENGFTPVDMTRKTTTHKIKNSVGVWNLRKDCTLGIRQAIQRSHTDLFHRTRTGMHRLYNTRTVPQIRRGYGRAHERREDMDVPGRMHKGSTLHAEPCLPEGADRLHP